MEKSPLSYTGVNAPNPANVWRYPKDPGATDWQNYTIGDFWQNTVTLKWFILSALFQQSATWQSVPMTAIFPGVETLTGNSGGAIQPNGVGNLNLVGSGFLTVTGTPGSNTLTISDSAGSGILHVGTQSETVSADSGGSIHIVGISPVTVFGDAATNTISIGNLSDPMTQLVADTGPAFPDSFGGINLVGGKHISTTSSTNSVTIASTVDPILTVSGQNNVKVQPDLTGNIKLAAGSGISITEGTNELTIANTQNSLLSVVGNDAVAVSPNPSGAWNLQGSGNLKVTGNAGSHTSTISNVQPPVLSLSGDANTTVPPNVSGRIQLKGAGGVTITETPGSNLLTVSASIVPDTVPGIVVIQNGSQFLPFNPQGITTQKMFENSAGTVSDVRGISSYSPGGTADGVYCLAPSSGCYLVQVFTKLTANDGKSNIYYSILINSLENVFESMPKQSGTGLNPFSSQCSYIFRLNQNDKVSVKLSVGNNEGASTNLTNGVFSFIKISNFP